MTLTISMGSGGKIVTVKDSVITFDVNSNGDGINILGSDNDVDVWMATGTTSGDQTGVCNIKWWPYVSGSSILAASWTSFNEGIGLPDLGTTIGTPYKQFLNLINTQVGATPIPVGFFPNSTGSMHFIGYTFTVPATQYYSVNVHNFWLGTNTAGVTIDVDYYVETIVFGRGYVNSGVYSGFSAFKMIPLVDLFIPKILLTTGTSYTVSFNFEVTINAMSGGDIGGWLLYCGFSPGYTTPLNLKGIS